MVLAWLHCKDSAGQVVAFLWSVFYWSAFLYVDVYREKMMDFTKYTKRSQCTVQVTHALFTLHSEFGAVNLNFIKTD